ncbi:SAM-dependent methyltransferase [Amycolatopsis taiwanensis]|uniref:SAM-dependent methyltransferase n=1 Tax=Amycolatopsis taiwanensis TaxID=342230 RepID=UPI0004B7C425|nr:SAM-dependent methyltransferase [Amycolatopsis taiwanensis]
MATPIEAQEVLVGAGNPSIARINDYWLGGSHHDQVHADQAVQIELCAPHIPYLVRASRALAGRMVRYLLDQGVRQFVDLGSGIPTMSHIHEIVADTEPGSTVVYVDLDPDVAEVAREVLYGQENVTYLGLDIRQPERILLAPEFRQLIDLDRPVGLLAIETLLYFTDAEDPAKLIATYIDRLSPGSYVGLSHCSENAELRTGLNTYRRMFGDPPDVTLRDRDQLATFFSGLSLVEPGIVNVPLWNPLTEDDVGQNPELAHMYTGLGRKP